MPIENPACARNFPIFEDPSFTRIRHLAFRTPAVEDQLQTEVEESMKPARATGHRWLRSIGMDAEVIGRDYTRAISGAENLHSGMKLSKPDQPVTV